MLSTSIQRWPQPPDCPWADESLVSPGLLLCSSGMLAKGQPPWPHQQLPNYLSSCR